MIQKPLGKILWSRWGGRRKNPCDRSTTITAFRRSSAHRQNTIPNSQCRVATGVRASASKKSKTLFFGRAAHPRRKKITVWTQTSSQFKSRRGKRRITRSHSNVIVTWSRCSLCQLCLPQISRNIHPSSGPLWPTVVGLSLPHYLLRNDVKSDLFHCQQPTSRSTKSIKVGMNLCMNWERSVRWKLTNCFSRVSWHDGDPEYLSDLDRQVMQKQRTRQVRNTNFTVTSYLYHFDHLFRCHESAKLKAAAPTSKTLTVIGEGPAVERQSRTRTNLNWTICFTIRQCTSTTSNIKADAVHAQSAKGQSRTLRCFR